MSLSKPQTLSVQDSTAVIAFSEAADAVATPRFYGALLEAVSRFLEWEIRGIIHYSRFRIPHYVIADNIPPEHLTMYFSGLYRFDPYFRYWREKALPGVLTLREACLPDDPDSEKYWAYFTSFLPRTGTEDDLCVLCPTIGGGAIGLFFDRKERFKQQEVATIRTLFPLISALHSANQRSVLQNVVRGDLADAPGTEARVFLLTDQDGKELLSSPLWKETVGNNPYISEAFASLRKIKGEDTAYFPAGAMRVENLGPEFSLHPGARIFFVEREHLAAAPLNMADALEALFGSALTPQELAIVRLIFAGYPSIDIARQLSISLGTVKNHRKRLFRKLDITTERELFLMLLHHIQDPDVRRAD